MGTKDCPYTPGTFRALQWAFGRHFALCRPCRRYTPLYLTSDLAERSIKTTRFICRQCSQPASLVDEDEDLTGFANVLDAAVSSSASRR